MAAQSPNQLFTPWLDLRAYKIADPVDRLRFLRREMGLLASEDEPKPSHRVRYSFVFWLAIAGFVDSAFQPPPGIHCRRRNVGSIARRRSTIPCPTRTFSESLAKSLADRALGYARNLQQRSPDRLRHLRFPILPRASYPVFALEQTHQSCARYGNQPGKESFTTRKVTGTVRGGANRPAEAIGAVPVG